MSSSKYENREFLLVVLMYLISRYAKKPNEGLARGIVHHLEIILQSPSPDHSMKNNHTLALLLEHWTEVVSKHQCKGSDSSLFLKEHVRH